MAFEAGPDFAQPIAQNGYAWWYVDAFSDDGLHGLTLIAMIGSVFSPYYARARRQGRGDPENYCALNVALYGKGGKRWTLTERGRGQLSRETTSLAVGPSALRWDGSGLLVDIAEITVPLPRRIEGTVRLFPSATIAQSFTLADHGQQTWRPIAPVARVEVDLPRPGLRWSGHGYSDWNSGSAPLEDAFKGWNWSRASSAAGTTILYDGSRRHEGDFSLALRIDAKGRIEEIAPPPIARLPPAPVWRIARETRADRGGVPRVVKTLEDTPFYSRTIMQSIIGGSPVTGMHESLSLDRFDTRWVQALLPFRMPRKAW
jgi:carotenoid 1,2-hydratase